jgi:hypothetical protein
MGQVKELVEANKELEKRVREAQERGAGWKMRVEAAEMAQESVRGEVETMKRMLESRFGSF